VGQRTENSVPYLRLLSVQKPGLEELKALGAAMAASGAVALYHLEGVTAEARLGDVPPPDAPTITIESLEEGCRTLDGTGQDIQLVWIGCPHAALAEIEQVVDLIQDRTLAAGLWITTARDIIDQAKASSLAGRLEASGGRLVADACLIGAPLRQMGFNSVVTNSAKGAFYLRRLQGFDVRFASLAHCVESAVTGKWSA
jgi:hypothetical protein